ncbi:MAG: sugar phosphate isomerase/epimerase [Acetobacterales bacterium]
MANDDALLGPTVTGVGTACPGIDGDFDRLDERLGWMTEIGCTHAEIAAVNLDVVLNGQVHPGRLDVLRGVCAGHRMTYSIHAPIAINLMDEANLDRHVRVLSACVELCAAIGGSIVVIHPGRVPLSLTPDMPRLLRVERTALLAVAPKAEAAGVQIALENLNPDTSVVSGRMTSYALHPGRVAEQVEAVGHAGVCGVIDFGHGYLSAGFLGFDLREALVRFAPVVNHLHLQDGFGQPVTMPGMNKAEQFAYGQGDMHLPLGWGDLDYRAILPALDLRPDTRMVVELAPRYMAHAPDSVARARALAALVNGSAAASAAR